MQFGYSPLILAAALNKKSIVELLLSRGASTNLTTKLGFSALDCARHNDHVEVVEILRPYFDQSASHARLPYGHGYVPATAEDRRLLVDAAKQGDIATVNRLLATTNVEIDTTDELGLNPLSYAQDEKNTKETVFLSQHGATLNTHEVVSVSMCVRVIGLMRTCIDTLSAVDRGHHEEQARSRGVSVGSRGGCQCAG